MITIPTSKNPSIGIAMGTDPKAVYGVFKTLLEA